MIKILSNPQENIMGKLLYKIIDFNTKYKDISKDNLSIKNITKVLPDDRDQDLIRVDWNQSFNVLVENCNDGTLNLYFQNKKYHEDFFSDVFKNYILMR